MVSVLNKPYHTREWREWLQAFTYLDNTSELVLKTFKTIEQSNLQFVKWWKLESKVSEKWYNHSFDSYEIAINKLKDLTGLIYYHDGQTDIWNITIDNIQYSSLWLRFLIQKKVILVCEKIDEYLAVWNIEACKRIIDDVFLLIRAIRAKGITEDTFNYDHNYGYDNDGHMLQIDVGSFRQWKTYVQEQKAKKLMLQNSTYIWLKGKSEELFQYHCKKCEELYL